MSYGFTRLAVAIIAAVSLGFGAAAGYQRGVSVGEERAAREWSIMRPMPTPQPISHDDAADIQSWMGILTEKLRDTDSALAVTIDEMKATRNACGVAK